jgi:hypothetical protein
MSMSSAPGCRSVSVSTVVTMSSRAADFENFRLASGTGHLDRRLRGAHPPIVARELHALADGLGEVVIAPCSGRSHSITE